MKDVITLTDKFIQRAQKVHGNRYNYSKSNYTNTDTKIIILCHKHGEFNQTPHNHISSRQGCPKCKAEKTSEICSSNTQEFIQKAKQVHKDTYDYSLVEYKNSKKKIKIICEEHGVFLQTPNNHLRNHGCPSCGFINIINKNKNNPMGWKTSDWIRVAKNSKTFDSFKVYIIKCWNDNEEFYKIGKTFTTVDYRFKVKGEKGMPYNYETIKIFEGEAKDMSKLEKQLQEDNQEFKYVPKLKFLGAQECFNKVIYV